jgi:hypothetical protein
VILGCLADGLQAQLGWPPGISNVLPFRLTVAPATPHAAPADARSRLHTALWTAGRVDGWPSTLGMPYGRSLQRCFGEGSCEQFTDESKVVDLYLCPIRRGADKAM